MTENVIEIDAPPQDAYDVLVDADAYRKWVVGAKNIRGADANWPQPGSRFYHTIGGGPATLDDTSKVIENVPNRRVVLEVRFRPFGIGRVAIDLEPIGDGSRTRVVMREKLTQGPAGWLYGPVLSVLINVRNALSLHRFERLVTSRARRY